MYLTQEQANDKDLITELSQRALQKTVKSIQALNGKISYNYELNGDTVFKLPSHRTTPTSWVQQSHYMPCLQEKISYQIPIPNIHQFQLPQGEIIGCFYPKIQGHTFSKSSFHQRSMAQKVAFFEELSEASYQLHTVSPESLPTKFQPFLTHIAQFLFKNSPQKQEEFKTNITHIFQSEGIPLSYSALCHTDLHPENVILDSKNHLVGLLDWDSLCLGSPFMEFHPPLYELNDLNLFQQVYQRTAKTPIDKAIIKYMNDTYENMFYLYAFAHLTSPENFKPKNKPHLLSQKDIQKIFSTDINRWANFGRD